MTRLLILIIFFGAFQSEGQNPQNMKEEISQAFIESKESVRSTTRWYICDEDSTYSKRDTLTLYNHSNYIYDPQNCCRFVKWQFHNKSHFTVTTTDICRNPGIDQLAPDRHHKLKFKIVENDLLLTIKNTAGRKSTFAVIEFKKEILWNKTDTSYVLRLKRIRK